MTIDPISARFPPLATLPVADLIDETSMEEEILSVDLTPNGGSPGPVADPANHVPGSQTTPPEAISRRFPNLGYHSVIGGSIRFNSGESSLEAPFLSILVEPGATTAESGPVEDGFSDIPHMDKSLETTTEFKALAREDGFEDIPELSESASPGGAGRAEAYPGPAHEAMMLHDIGAIIGARLIESITLDNYEITVSELARGMKFQDAYSRAPSPQERLALLNALAGVHKELFAHGYSVVGAGIGDFVVSAEKVCLTDLSALVPLKSVHPSREKSGNAQPPESAHMAGPKDLGSVLYGLGLQFLELASGKSIASWNSGPGANPLDGMNELLLPSPELSRLLSSLLARDPEYRLGKYQEIGAEETWARLEQMTADWANSGNRPCFRVAGATTIGVYRENNEDAFGSVVAHKRGVGYGRHAVLAMVSDGMGGGAVGEIASTMTIESISRSLSHDDGIYAHIGASSLEPVPEGGYADKGVPVVDPEAHAAAMSKALIRAHHEVKEAADRGGESCGGMGATAVAIHISEWNAVIGHVGDSRAYLARNGTIRQLTTDHSAVQKLVGMGLLTQAEADNHSRRHELSQAIGGFEEVAPEVAHLELQHGDTILLCTDGVTNVMSAEDLLGQLAVDAAPDLIASRILATVNALGAPDNATVLIIKAE